MAVIATYHIASGQLDKPSGVATGLWSGHGPGYNNPEAVDQKGVGPLPPGTYALGPLLQSHGTLGPCVIALTQIAGESYGRGSFYVHGASSTHPEMSSDGCIIAPRDVRLALAMDAAKVEGATLEVVP